MTRSQAHEVLSELRDTYLNCNNPEDNEDVISALYFALADMNTLQEVMNAVSCVSED